MGADVGAAVDAVLARTDALAALPPDETSMLQVDRGADACVSAFRDALDAVTRGFSADVVRRLSSAKPKRVASATHLLVVLFPKGTGYLTRP